MIIRLGFCIEEFGVYRNDKAIRLLNVHFYNAPKCKGILNGLLALWSKSLSACPQGLVI